jgi:hypothetical protein
VIFSVKLIIVFRVILFDVLFQGRVFKGDVPRWLAHMLIFYGFMLLLGKGPSPAAVLTPFSFARGLLIQPTLHADDYTLPIENAVAKVAADFAELTKPDVAIPLNSKSSDDRQPILQDRTFSHCFSCQSCTTVCPDVANYDQPEQELGL